MYHMRDILYNNTHYISTESLLWPRWIIGENVRAPECRPVHSTLRVMIGCGDGWMGLLRGPSWDRVNQRLRPSTKFTTIRSTTCGTSTAKYTPPGDSAVTVLTDEPSLIQQQVGVNKPVPLDDFTDADVQTPLEHGA